MTGNLSVLHPQIQIYVEQLLPSVGDIPAERRATLDRVAQFVQAKLESEEPAKLTFICTHNSRRSHIAELWAATAAAYFGLDGVQTFSGGTEATAFSPQAVAALERAGFEIDEGEPPDNPRYPITFSPKGPKRVHFSKEYDHDPNPREDFAAIMTCSQADEACPVVFGAALRVTLPYDDPKATDGTPEEATRYDERTRQIATEMLYLFSKVGG